MTRPNKLLFDPSQPFKIEIIKDTLGASLNNQQYINIFVKKKFQTETLPKFSIEKGRILRFKTF